MWDAILDVIFPRFCIGCGHLGKFICGRCASDIPYFSDQVCPYCELPSPYGLTHPRCQKAHGLDGLFVLAHYRGLIPKIIHQIKYQGVYSASGEVAELILDRYHQQYKFHYFVPVPLSKKREAERGFNQAEKLANALGKSLDQAKVVNLLQRVKDTRPQFDLKYEERKKNLTDALTLNRDLVTRNLANISFCLVDDVATTGSTLFECAKVLKKTGAAKVYAITIARGG